MKLRSAHLKLADGDTTHAEHRAERTHVWLLPLGVVRGAWVMLAAIALITFGISVPIYYEHLTTVCRAATTDACWQGRQLAAEQNRHRSCERCRDPGLPAARRLRE